MVNVSGTTEPLQASPNDLSGVIVPDLCYLNATAGGATQIGFYGEGNLSGIQYLGGAQGELKLVPTYIERGRAN